MGQTFYIVFENLPWNCVDSDSNTETLKKREQVG